MTDTCLHGFFVMPEISLYEISSITTKAPCEAARVGARHVHIEISDFVMHTVALCQKMSAKTAQGFCHLMLWTDRQRGGYAIISKWRIYDDQQQDQVQEHRQYKQDKKQTF